MISRVTRRGEEVERAVMEVVDGGKAADAKLCLETELVHGALGGIGREDRGGRVSRIRRQKIAAEAWADN